MDNNEKEAARPIRLQGTLWWYLLCAATIFGLMAGSVCGGIMYCYGVSRDLWWHPTKILSSLEFALFLPIPHILVASSRLSTSIARLPRSNCPICPSLYRPRIVMCGGDRAGQSLLQCKIVEKLL